jgi:hypothetical protein
MGQSGIVLLPGGPQGWLHFPTLLLKSACMDEYIPPPAIQNDKILILL